VDKGDDAGNEKCFFHDVMVLVARPSQRYDDAPIVTLMSIKKQAITGVHDKSDDARCCSAGKCVVRLEGEVDADHRSGTVA